MNHLFSDKVQRTTDLLYFRLWIVSRRVYPSLKLIYNYLVFFELSWIHAFVSEAMMFGGRS
jgi:hypothetical protein